MVDRVISKRYAEGFLDYLRDHHEVEGELRGLESLKKTLKNNPAFLKLLSVPQVSQKEKFDLIDRVWQGTALQAVCHLLKLLVKKNYLKNIFEIIHTTAQMATKDFRIEAKVTLAFTADEPMVARLRQGISQKFQKSVDLTVEYSPDVVGGAQIVIGNTLIDGTIKYRLAKLKEQLMSVKVA